MKMQNSESGLLCCLLLRTTLGWTGNGPVYTSHLSSLISPPQGTGCHLFTLRPSTGWREDSVKCSIIIFMVNSIWRGMMLIRQPRPQTDSLLIVMFVNPRCEGSRSLDCLFSTRQYSPFICLRDQQRRMLCFRCYVR